MFEGHKVVCLIPSGRRRYMHSLIPYLVSDDIVDEIHLWINTKSVDDLQYLDELHKMFSKVKLIDGPPMVHANGQDSVGRFYTKATDPGTIYVKLDDDVVFLEKNFFRKFLTYRVENRECLMCFPMTINNAMCTYIKDFFGLLKNSEKFVISPFCGDPRTYSDPFFAEKVHRHFIESYHSGKLDSLKHESFHFNFTMSINCCSWFGEDFLEFGGHVPDWKLDENYLTFDKLFEVNKRNGFCGSVLISHFAFFVQRRFLDQTNLLEEYYAISRNEVAGFDWESFDALKTVCNFDQVIDSEVCAAGKCFGNALVNMKIDKAYIWGTGGFFDNVKNTFKDCKIEAFIDNNFARIGCQKDGVPIISPFELNARPRYPIFVCSFRRREIAEQLRLNAPNCGDIYFPC